MTYKDKGWGNDYLDNQRRAELLFQQLLSTYPQSDKIGMRPISSATSTRAVLIGSTGGRPSTSSAPSSGTHGPSWTPAPRGRLYDRYPSTATRPARCIKKSRRTTPTRAVFKKRIVASRSW